jgi:NADH:ubiquinone oxidoreductase subunit K
VIGIEHYVVVSSILFVLGVLGIFLNRKNIIVILMAIELILLAVNINLVAFSAFLGDRACHSRGLFPRPGHHCGRRCQPDEGITNQ